MDWSFIADCATAAFLLIGCFFALTGGIGILRMPDFYTRLHPAGKNDTFGQGLILVGLLFQVDWSSDWTVGGKLLLILLFLAVTAPTATYAITKAAHLDGLQPWSKSADD